MYNTNTLLRHGDFPPRGMAQNDVSKRCLHVCMASRNSLRDNRTIYKKWARIALTKDNRS